MEDKYFFDIIKNKSVQKVSFKSGKEIEVGGFVKKRMLKPIEFISIEDDVVYWGINYGTDDVTFFGVGRLSQVEFVEYKKE